MRIGYNDIVLNLSLTDRKPQLQLLFIARSVHQRIKRESESVRTHAQARGRKCVEVLMDKSETIAASPLSS